MMEPPVLAIDNLSVAFDTPGGTVQALRNVSLAVPRAAIVGVVGESGSGKSTLMGATLGLLAANARIAAGSVRLNGEELIDASPRRLRDLRGRKIAAVFQDPMTALNPVLSIAQQMTDIQYRSRERGRAEKRRRAAEMLARVGIPDADERLDRYPYEFSGGMRQRIAIAMALLENPGLLIADEPTTALDVTLEAQIVHLLRALRADFNASILFISHDLGLVAELCDYVVVLYAGEVAERAPVRELFHRAQHPYTQALLECDPARIAETRRVLPTIEGEVPNLIELPRGCVFADRCARAFERCREAPPPEVTIGADHAAACYLARTAS